MSGHRKAGADDPVSIILCTYNRASLIPRAIRSVIRQTHKAWHLFVIDDGSTDDTRPVVSRFSGKDPRISYFYQPNRGLSSARNEGLRRADGAYVAFIDSDDAWKPRHLELRVSHMRGRRNVDAIYGGLVVKGPREKQYVADLEHPGKRVHVSRCYVGGTFFLRSSVVRKRRFRFRDIPFGEDYDLMMRMQRRLVVRAVPEFRTYVYYCDSPDRLCDAFTASLTPGPSGA